MKRLLASLILLGNTAWAQTTQTTAPVTTVTETSAATATTSTATVETSAKKPFSLSLDTESITGRDEGKSGIDRVETSLYPTVSYNLLENSNIALYPRFVVEKKAEDYETKNDYLALRFTQANILTEDVNGVDFKADARYYGHVTEDSQKENKADGLFNVRTYLDKKLSDKFSLNNHNRFFVTNQNKYSNGETSERKVDLRLTPSYENTEKVSTAVELQYVGDYAEAKKSDKVLVTPTVNYTANDKLSLSFELEFQPFVSKDNETFGKETLFRPTLNYTFNDKISGSLIAELPVYGKSGDANKVLLSDLDKKFSLELDLSIVAF